MNQKRKLSYRDIFGYLLIGLSVIMLGKSLMLCFSNDIWYDELFTVGMIEHSYGDLIAFTARDVHPPLYYCIVKFAVELCKLISPMADTAIIAKIVSVLPYLILLLYSVTLIRKRFGIFTGGLFLFCLITMPQLSTYTVEVRMYSWALLFVTAAILHAYEIVISAKRHAAALVLYGLAAAYTHYFACVAVIMVYLYVFAAFLINDRRRIKQWFLWVTVSVVGYIPWLFALYRQITAVTENYWILPLSWRSLGGCVKFLMKPAFAGNALSTVLAVVMFAVYSCVYVWNVVKLYHSRRERRRSADIGYDVNDTDKHNHHESIQKQRNDVMFMTAGIGVLAGLVLFGFTASAVLRPIFVYRYMIPAMGCFWLSFAVGLGKLSGSITKQPTAVFLSVRRKIITATVLAGGIYQGITAAVCVLVLLIGFRGYQAFTEEEENKIFQMEYTTAAFQQISSGDILIFNFDQVQMVAGYYVKNGSYLWYGQPEALVQEICGQKGILNEDTARIKEWISQGREVWFIGSFNSREDIVEGWKNEGLHAELTWTNGYLLERYWFNLYKLSII